MTATRSLSSAGCTTASSRPCCHWAAAPNSCAGSVPGRYARREADPGPGQPEQHVCGGGQARRNPAVVGRRPPRQCGRQRLVPRRWPGRSPALPSAPLCPPASARRRRPSHSLPAGGGRWRWRTPGDAGSSATPREPPRKATLDPRAAQGGRRPGQARGGRVPRPRGQPGPAQRAHIPRPATRVAGLRLLAKRDQAPGSATSRYTARPRRRSPPAGQRGPTGQRPARPAAGHHRPVSAHRPASRRSRHAAPRQCARPAAAAAARDPACCG